MDKTSARGQRPSQPDRYGFALRNRPDQLGNRTASRATCAQRDDRRYPERCHPDRAKPPLNTSQQDLATQYLPLARAMARQMKTRFPGAREEFESAAFLALVEAAQSFDSSRNVNFATYARYRIRGALYDVYRELIGTTSTGTHAQARLERPLCDGWESQGRVIGAEPDLPVGTDLEIQDTVENWIRRLPRMHALAFRHIYLDGKSQNEAAHPVGCSKWKLCRMHSQAITWLQEAKEREFCS